MPFKETPHTQSLVVALRVRPLSSAELGEPEIIHVLDENLVVLRDPYEDQDDILRANRSREKQYVFDHAFGPNASQVDVFSVTTKPLIHNVVSGYNATVFAYGATGAGKTYTMLGNDRKLGIMGLTLNDLFAEMELTKEDVKYKVTMSYLEIYNEMIRDLLNPSTGILELREDAKGVNVTGLSEVEAKTTSKVMEMLLMGNKQRMTEPTAANKTSSRSHAILQVIVKQKSRVENVIQEVKVGKLFMIDLAGSERAAQTKNRGKRMIEGAHINRSLLALGNCINALSENRGHYVNFRDSKLTRLLKDSLGGNCKTVMIAHVSPAGKGFEESRNTLLYADRAKNIKTTIKKNQFNVSYHIAQYTNIISDLRKEIFRLKTKIAEQSVSEVDSNKTTFEEPSEHPKSKDHAEMNRIRNQLVSTFREQMEIRHKLMELEDVAMQIALDTNRYMLVIDEWEQEKARRVVKNAEMEKERHEKDDESTTLVDKNGKPVWIDKDEEDDTSEELRARSSSYEDVENKDLDTEKDKKVDVEVQESEPFSMAEPEEVTFAREEINNLVAEEKRVSEMKITLQSKLQQTRKEVERLEEQLPKKISSEENREILSLICKVHELEITNAELQSQALLRENVLRYKDLEVSKYESRQKLCDEIIQMQRAVINDAQVNCPSELEGLYEVYLQQSSDTDERDSLHSARPESTASSAGPPVSVNRAAVLAGINRRMTSRENPFTFTSKLSPLTEETPSRLVSLQNSPVKTTRPTPSTYNALRENSLTESSPTSPAHTPKCRSRVSSPDDISIRSSFFLTTPKNPNNDTENHAPLTPVFSKTQKFTELATRRRVMMENGLVSTDSLREDASPSKLSSLVSVRENERDRPVASVSDTSLGVNSNKQAVKPSLSLGDLSMIDKKASDQASVDSVPVTRRRIAKKGKGDQGKRSTPTKPNKRQRSASLDDTKVHRVKPRRTTRKGQQEASKLHRPNQHQVPSKIRERVSLGHEASNPAGNTNNKRSRISKALVHFNATPRGVARNKEQAKKSRVQTNDYQDGELQTFLTNVTPTSTVRQIGTPPGKGLTIKKRYRAPSDITGSDSNQSTPRLKPRKQQPVGNSPVDALSVSGVAMRPTKQFAGLRRF